MISKNAFLQTVSGKVRLLDGATGSALLQAGMERGCCQEKWILDHPEVLPALS